MKKIFILLFAVCFIAISCQDDFLEVHPQGGEISGERLSEVVEIRPELAAALLNGVYVNLYEEYTGGVDQDQSDFGKSYDLATDIMSGSFAKIKSGYQRFLAQEQWQSNSETSNDMYKPWRMHYRLVEGANSVIKPLGGEGVPELEASKVIWGEAITIRSYAYLKLSTYFGDEDKAVLPYYNSESIVAQATKPENRVFILKSIMADMEKAVVALKGVRQDGTAGGRIKVDESVAQAVLAYVYLELGVYDNDNTLFSKAIDVADEVLSRKIMINAEGAYRSGFNNSGAENWIWGVHFTDDNKPNLGSWWGMVDFYTRSYQWYGDGKFCMDADLFSQIPTNDIRYYQFPQDAVPLTDVTRAISVTKFAKGMPCSKFFGEARIPCNNYYKNDEVFIRAAEMHLIKAECQARLGNDPSAELNVILNARKVTTTILPVSEFKEGTVEADLTLGWGDMPVYTTYTDPLQKVYQQWRIEMFAEGETLSALRRLGHSQPSFVVKRGENHFHSPSKDFEYKDIVEYIMFNAPQNEEINNPKWND
jgi:hypothetical protein